MSDDMPADDAVLPLGHPVRPGQPRVPLAAQLAEVEREISVRRRVYKDWIRNGRLKEETAEFRIAAMEAAAETLRHVIAERT